MNGVWQRSGCVIAFCIGSVVAAGPDWVEGTDGGGDAGSTPMTAQPVIGDGPVTNLLGGLSTSEGVAATDDFEDMYLLKISDFSTFDITTEPAAGVAPDFDTVLWLFTGPDHPLGEGIGLLANDNFPGLAGGASRLLGMVTEGFLPDPPLLDGLSYYIAISGAGRFPVDQFGDALFSFDTNDEISSADGSGGQNPIAGWMGVGEVGSYNFPDMQGTRFVPAPSSLLTMVGAAGLVTIRRRR